MGLGLRTTTLVTLAGLLLAAADTLAQRVYQWVDEEGRVQFSQTPPPDGRAVQTRELATTEISGERREYCADVHSIAREMARWAAAGVPMSSAMDRARRFEMRERIDVNEVAMRELVAFVYAAVNRGRFDDRVAGRAQDACISGSFGNLGRQRSAATEDDGDAHGRTAPSAGTGWVSHGHVVTNQHVVDGRHRIRVRLQDGRELTASIVDVDRDNDIAILRVHGALPPGLPIAHQEARLGADVFTLGFPHTEIMGRNAKLTTGIVSSTTGMRDDPRLYQISVPVQAGNSGGPLIGMNGEVVGVVTAKLRVDAVYRATGDLTQNVNYAVKAQAVRALLPGAAGADDLSPQTGALDELAERAAPAVVMVLAE